MASNLVGEERLTLFRYQRKQGGNVLTVPIDTLSAVISVIKGQVRFTLDNSDPIKCDGVIAYQGQTINISNWEKMQSIVKQLKMISIAKESKIVAWYFD